LGCVYYLGEVLSMLLRFRLFLPLALCLLPVPAHVCLGADPPPPSVATPAEAPVEVSVSDKGISISAVGVQAHELLTKLARATGTGIIVDDTVGKGDGDKFTSRLITLNLVDTKLTKIIEYICAAYGLSHAQVGKVFMISEGIPKNPSSYLMSDIDSVTTEYVVSSKAKSLLPEFLQAHVKVNEGKNSVILSGPTEVLAKFRRDIKQFDVPAAQIMIDVIMVEFTDAAAKDLGFDFLWSNAGKGGSIGSSGGDIIFHSLGALTREFTANLKALVEKKKATVHANPRIATVSGQNASIFVGRQRYLNQPVEISGSGGMNYIDAGIKLEMTPWTGGGGEIITSINTEVSVMSAPDPVTGLPEKSTRRASTQVSVHDGETIVIGGLVQDELQLTRTRVPVLGEIPILGALFRGVSRSETKTELVIFITPRVLTADNSLSEPKKDELLSRFGAETTGK
jgi:hypothetical protein